MGIFAPNPTANSSNGTVATSQTTTSLSYTDLATSGPAVTLTTGTKVLVIISCYLANATSGDGAEMGFAVSGATTIAAADNNSIYNKSDAANGEAAESATFFVTVTAGSNTFTSKYRARAGGTATFQDRFIAVIPLN